MKVCVVGAGAVGGHLAARLAAGGADVSVLARGATLAAIRERGLAVRAGDGPLHARPAASDDPLALGVQDAVVVAVKAPALPAIAASLPPLLGPDTAVAFMMNGVPWWYFHAEGGAADGTRLPLVDPGGAMWDAIGPQRAVGGVVYSACTVVAPGTITVEGSSKFILGEPSGGPSERAERLAATLRQGGVGSEVTPRIRDAVWTKLLLNLAIAPLSVLGLAGQSAVLTERECTDAMRRLLEEGMAIARAVGATPRCDPDQVIADAARLKHMPSMAQDLSLGRKLEIDAILEAPLALGRAAGIAAPTLGLLTALVKVRARSAGLYDS